MDIFLSVVIPADDFRFHGSGNLHPIDVQEKFYSGAFVFKSQVKDGINKEDQFYGIGYFSG